MSEIMSSIDNSIISQTFKNQFLPYIAHGLKGKSSDYIINSPQNVLLPYNLVRRINTIYKKLSIDSLESNMEVVLDMNEVENTVNFDVDSAFIYTAGLNTLRVSADKIIVYGIKDEKFPTTAEIVFAENNKFLVSIRILRNGGLIMYGHPTNDFLQFVQKKKEKYIKKDGEMAYSNLIEGFPEWYFEMPKIELKGTVKEAVNNLNKISKIYSMPIYISEFTLEYQYKTLLKSFKNEEMIDLNDSLEKSRYINMIKVTNKWGMYKEVLKDSIQ